MNWGLDRPLVELCDARLSGGRGYCQAIAIKGSGRCRWHGGRSTGPRSAAGKAKCVAAMKAGRARWLEDMRALKQLGLIELIPGGMPRRPDRFVARALRALEKLERLYERDP
jgi:hypothetical protein